MGSQFRLPPRRPYASNRDPRERLARLHQDVTKTKAEIRDVLDRLAVRHGISPKDIAYAIEGYADNMLSDAVYNLESELESEVEAQDPI